MFINIIQLSEHWWCDEVKFILYNYLKPNISNSVSIISHYIMFIILLLFTIIQLITSI